VPKTLKCRFFGLIFSKKITQIHLISFPFRRLTIAICVCENRQAGFKTFGICSLLCVLRQGISAQKIPKLTEYAGLLIDDIMQRFCDGGNT
jgi:hypothetical protein